MISKITQRNITTSGRITLNFAVSLTYTKVSQANLGITNFFSPKTPGSRIGRAPITRHGEHRQNKLLTQSRQKTPGLNFR